ncbi:MAG: phage holin family protein [Lachnospiraceae bacterium]|nr:phage holin family protein [Bacteroides sp.]MCM1223131.1 phage holin family protein [Lachnospiraceae bacterium]
MWEIVPISKITLFAGIFLAISLLVVFAIMLDLWDGVHTARVTKERVHSHKLRVTIDKMSEYWRFLIIGFLIDCIGLIFSFYIMPFMVVLFGVGLIIIEIKSMFEHAKRRKSNTTELPTILHQIVKCANEKDAHDLVEKINILFSERQTETTLKLSEQ